RMASVIFAASTPSGSNETVARSAARFTEASRTPGTALSPFSIRATQLAQLIPRTGSSMWLVIVPRASPSHVRPGAFGPCDPAQRHPAGARRLQHLPCEREWCADQRQAEPGSGPASQSGAPPRSLLAALVAGVVVVPHLGHRPHH